VRAVAASLIFCSEKIVQMLPRDSSGWRVCGRIHLRGRCRWQLAGGFFTVAPSRNQGYEEVHQAEHTPPECEYGQNPEDITK
jgi:hypothetical protein